MEVRGYPPAGITGGSSPARASEPGINLLTSAAKSLDRPYFSSGIGAARRTACVASAVRAGAAVGIPGNPASATIVPVRGSINGAWPTKNFSTAGLSFGICLVSLPIVEPGKLAHTFLVFSLAASKLPLTTSFSAPLSLSIPMAARAWFSGEKSVRPNFFCCSSHVRANI